MVSNQLAKMEKDFQAGKPFPDLPVIQDAKAFQVKKCSISQSLPRTFSLCLTASDTPSYAEVMGVVPFCSPHKSAFCTLL